MTASQPTTTRGIRSFVPRRVLVVVTIAAMLAIGWLVWSASRYRYQEKLVDEIGRECITYADEVEILRGNQIATRNKREYTWIESQLGHYLFRNPVWFSNGGGNFSDEDVSHLVNLTTLTKVDLSETAVTDEGALKLQQLPRLEELDVGRTQWTAKGVRTVSAIPSLRKISLIEVPLNGQSDGIYRMTNLEYLQIADTGIDDADLKNVKELPALRWICVSGNEGITGEGLQYLAGCPALESLIGIGIGRVNDIDLRVCEHLPELQNISLDSSYLSGECFKYLIKCKELQTANIDVDIDERHAIDLSKIPKLKYLNVRSISDPAKAALKQQLPSLVIAAP